MPDCPLIVQVKSWEFGSTASRGFLDHLHCVATGFGLQDTLAFWWIKIAKVNTNERDYNLKKKWKRFDYNSQFSLTVGTSASPRCFWERSDRTPNKTELSFRHHSFNLFDKVLDDWIELLSLISWIIIIIIRSITALPNNGGAPRHWGPRATMEWISAWVLVASSDDWRLEWIHHPIHRPTVAPHMLIAVILVGCYI